MGEGLLPCVRAYLYHLYPERELFQNRAAVEWSFINPLGLPSVGTSLLL